MGGKSIVGEVVDLGDLESKIIILDPFEWRLLLIMLILTISLDPENPYLKIRNN